MFKTLMSAVVVVVAFSSCIAPGNNGGLDAGDAKMTAFIPMNPGVDSGVDAGSEDAGADDAGLDAGADDAGTDDAGVADAGVDAGRPAVHYCQVAVIIGERCASCHTTPTAGGPPLTTRVDLLMPSPNGGLVIDRAIFRMEAMPESAAMPPDIGGNPSDIQLFKDWRTNAFADCPP